jgi:hypothetical protein
MSQNSQTKESKALRSKKHLKPLDPQLLDEIKSKIDLNAIANESLVDGNSIQRSARLKKIALFSQLQEKYSHMKYSNSEICDLMNISPSTMSRIRRELDVVSPYRYENTRYSRPKKKKENKETENEESKQTEKIIHIKPNTINSKKRTTKPKGSVENIPTDNDISSDAEVDDLLNNAGSKYNS